MVSPGTDNLPWSAITAVDKVPSAGFEPRELFRQYSRPDELVKRSYRFASSD